ASLTFTAQSGGTAPAQIVSLSSSGTALSYSISSSVTSPTGGTWLQVPTQSGTTNGSLSVAVNTAGLAPGTYTGVVNISAPTAGNTALSVPVTLNITSGPVLQLGASALSFAYQTGQQQPQSQTVSIGSTTGTVGYTVSTLVAPGQSWLSASPTSG